MWNAWKWGEKRTGFWQDNMKERGHLKDRGVEGTTGLEWILGG
jgi:hypothetical protein